MSNIRVSISYLDQILKKGEPQTLHVFDFAIFWFAGTKFWKMVKNCENREI